ncbi:MAG TPA: MBL fold metallo-hydrolase [Candidatus Saccharimonadales bacterium]|nr:MBL fold metallo-hydrolase [Candidatus Saccharimonadales bacterium]
MRRPASRRVFRLAILVLAFACGQPLSGNAPDAGTNPEPLQIEVHAAGESGFNVTATLIYGKTEAILVDSQFHLTDARDLASRVAATGRTLKAIFITHADDDHYMGAAALRERFPRTPIYMAPAGLREFRRTAAEALAAQKKRAPAETPETLPEPEPLPGSVLRIDGHEIKIVEDIQGDYSSSPSNSMVWVPSLRTVITGDVVFSGIHPWLAGSTPETRAAWLRSLKRVALLHPLRVVPGHLADTAPGDGLDALSFMTSYLETFDELRKSEPDADAFVQAMERKFTGLGQEKFLTLAAKSTYGK